MKYYTGSYLYFTGLELYLHYHYHELKKVENFDNYSQKYNHSFVMFKPEKFKFSEKQKLIDFCNNELYKRDKTESGNELVLNTSEFSRFYNELSSKINAYVNRLNEVEIKQGLESSLYFLNHQDIDFTYDDESLKYYSEIFTYKNIENENVELLGAINYFHYLNNVVFW